MEKGFLGNSEVARYEQLSNTYLVTKSPAIVDEMYENFRASDIYTWEDNAVILYNLAKKYPATFKDAPELKREYILKTLVTRKHTNMYVCMYKCVVMDVN